MKTTTRRNFLKSTATLAALSSVTTITEVFAKEKKPKDISAKTLPIFKGFNLLNYFHHTAKKPFNEHDFELIKSLGFNFVRIPLSYWCWSSEDNWYNVDEKVLESIDKCVDLGKQYNLHVNINFHRVPGYCINKWQGKTLPTNLFNDEAPLDACAFHWKTFAKRYKCIANRNVSFNLINEAPHVESKKYEKVARRLIKEIRDVDANRLIFVDGLNIGQKPLLEIMDIDNIVQSGRGYFPSEISHFQATWCGDYIKNLTPDKISWPLKKDGKIIDKQALVKHYDTNWKPFLNKGGKIHIGEMGAYNKAPHDIVLAWLEDLFSIYRQNNWGWSLWNLKGGFGIFNSERKDVAYENYKGLKLDRKMLEILLRS